MSPSLQRRDLLALGAACSLTLVSLWVALANGSLSISPWDWLLHPTRLSAVDVQILEQLRWPRALAALNTGALLALAGVLMQVLLRNPLAEPYVLGVSGGSAVAALSAILLGLGTLWVSAAAFVGALISMLLVFSLALWQGQWSAVRLLLTGVVTAAGWNAITTLLLAISPDASLRGMMFWLMGDLSLAQSNLWTCLGVVGAGVLAWLLAPALDLLARGEQQAQVLGVAVRPLRIACYLLASLCTAAAVTLAGTVGFVGLIVPHMVRMLMGGRHRLLIPLSMLCGASLLLIADSLARSLLAPQQIPVGVITAFLGIPVFLLLLRRSRLS